MRLINFILSPKKSRLESYAEAATVIEAFVGGSSGKRDGDMIRMSPAPERPY